MKPLQRTAMIMAAGTGGHIIPGLALADALIARGWKVVWLGTERGMENHLVPPKGIILERLCFHGVRGKGHLGPVKGSWQLLSALIRSIGLLLKHRPDVVIGMGGYVCLPGGLATGMLRRPLLLVNADANLLLSNKALLPFAKVLACGFDGPAAKTARKALVTGNPVRSEIAQLLLPEQRFAGRSGPLNILVIGGSLGAQVLNDTVPRALTLLSATEQPIVVHQTGKTQWAAVKDIYQALGWTHQAEVLPFIDDMARRLAQCDVIICRAGAITVSELCAAGVASILVPLIVSTTAHQLDNARWMEQAGAAIMLPQRTLTADRLIACLRQLNRNRLLAMAQQARRLALPNATEKITDLCHALAAGTFKA